MVYSVNYYHSVASVFTYQNPEGAQRSINQWVERKSNDKIKQLLPPGSVTADTKVVLANVLHFRSRWQRAFDQTDKGPPIYDVTLMLALIWM